MATYTDKYLTEFLDGTLPEDAMAELALALETDESLAERIAGLDIDLPELKAGFDDLLAEAPVDKFADMLRVAETTVADRTVEVEEAPVADKGEESNVVSLASRRRVSTPIWGGMAAAAAVAAVAIGVNLGQGPLAPEPAPLKWKAAAAIYTNLFTTDTFDNVNPTADEQSDQIQTVLASLDADVSPAQLDLEGYTFKQARSLAFNDVPLGQLMFTDASGAPMALCLFKNGAADSDVTLANIQGLDVASFSKGGISYIVIGGQGVDAVTAAASQVVAQI